VLFLKEGRGGVHQNITARVRPVDIHITDKSTIPSRRLIGN